MKVALVDTGGNLASVKYAFERLGATVSVVRYAEEINAEGLVLPGQGRFDAVMGALASTALPSFINSGAIPVLGICVGMQILFENSDEAPGVAGVGAFKGTVSRLGAKRLPHMGWSFVYPRDSYFYFAHSFAASPFYDTMDLCNHEGAVFAATVKRGSLWGCQFHPEKSGDAGMEYLREWMQQ